MEERESNSIGAKWEERKYYERKLRWRWMREKNSERESTVETKEKDKWGKAREKIVERDYRERREKNKEEIIVKGWLIYNNLKL